MKWNPHLTFDGRCKEAFEFYETCLGGKVVASGHLGPRGRKRSVVNIPSN